MATEIFSAADLEKLIGYTFHKKVILEEARTRGAYCNENQSEILKPMDALATLGDSVLDTVVVFQLYKPGKCTSKELTEDKIKQVKREKTAAFAKKHNLRRFILWGAGELKQNNCDSDKALDTVTEALIGAVFYDAQTHDGNGLIVVQNLLTRMNFFQTSAVE
jgi:ribonuclease-3